MVHRVSRVQMVLKDLRVIRDHRAMLDRRVYRAQLALRAL